MEAARNINGGNLQDVRGDLNRHYQNNSVQMAGQDNEATHVQGSQNNTAGDTINNSRGGQVTIFKQYFQLDYSGFQGNTVDRYPLSNNGMYPMAPSPHGPLHIPYHNPWNATCQHAPAGCPHVCHPRIHPTQLNYQPMMHPPYVSPVTQNPRADSIGLFHIPAPPPLAFLPPISSPLLIPIFVPIPSQVVMLVPTPVSAAVGMPASHNVNAGPNSLCSPYTLSRGLAQGGPSNSEMQSPSHSPPFPQLPTQTHVPPCTMPQRVGLSDISRSPAEVGDFENVSRVQLEPSSPSINQPSTSQRDNFSTLYYPNGSAPVDLGFASADTKKRLPITLGNELARLCAPLTQPEQPSLTPVESSQTEEATNKALPDQNEEEEQNPASVVTEV